MVLIAFFFFLIFFFRRGSFCGSYSFKAINWLIPRTFWPLSTVKLKHPLVLLSHQFKLPVQDHLLSLLDRLWAAQGNSQQLRLLHQYGIHCKGQGIQRSGGTLHCLFCLLTCKTATVLGNLGFLNAFIFANRFKNICSNDVIYIFSEIRFHSCFTWY